LQRVDNLAHTLVGAALGRAVGAGRVPAAGWIGAVAANAPDWSEFLLGFWPSRGSIPYYEWHRGITHSFVGAAMSVVVIACAVWLLHAAVHRLRTRADGGSAPRLPIGVLAMLVGATVFSHVYMDWQGSYGVRLFLPWDATWYYADWVAIVDPFFWLVPLVALAWGSERHWRDLLPAILLAAIIAFLVLVVDGVPAWLRVGCVVMLVLGAVGWVRHWFGVAPRRRVSAFALLALACYAGAQGVASVPAKAAARRTAVTRFGADAQWAALTRIGHPFTWEPVVASRDTVAGPGWVLPRLLDDPRVQHVLRETTAGRALGQFARFLTATVDSGPGGIIVTLRDARYARPPATGWAVVTVPLPVNAPH
jgi:membrane-bound metal-dependent hydrolase YbcI (DUF457 family)